MKHVDDTNDIRNSVLTVIQSVEVFEKSSTNEDIGIRIKSVENNVSYLIRNTCRVAEKVSEMGRFLREQSKIIDDVNDNQVVLKEYIASVNRTLTSAIEQLHPKSEEQ